MKEKAAYLKGLIDGLGIDETTKEGKVIKAMSELLGELAEAVDAIDEDVTHAYDQINDLSEELEDLEADLYEDDDTDDADEEPEEDAEDAEDSGDDDDNADVAGEPYYEVACPACGNTVYVSEDDLDAGEAICPSCNVAFEVALADEDDDEAPEEPDDGPARYEVTCPACVRPPWWTRKPCWTASLSARPAANRWTLRSPRSKRPAEKSKTRKAPGTASRIGRVPGAFMALWERARSGLTSSPGR